MIKKFFIYCMSDGIIPAVRFACKTLFSKLLSNSTTVFLEYENCRSKHSDMNSCITIKKTELTDVIKLDFPRLKESDYQKWLQNGSTLYIGYIENIPISYTWTHYNGYTIHGLCDFKLEEIECWIGPTFISKNFRGQGYNKQQIAYQIANENAKKFYTSVNSDNIASLKSFQHLGFKIIGTVTRKTLFFRSKVILSGSDYFKNKLVY